MTTQEVIHACDIFFGEGSNAGQRKEADAWLTKWQMKETAWEVANDILEQISTADTSKKNVNLAFYAANTLRTKIQLDVNNLDTKEKMEFMRKAIFNHMLKFRDAQPFGSVLNQLCLALCGLAIQMDKLWPNLIQSLIEQFSGDVLNYIILLDILRFMPEESKNKRLLTDTQKRENCREELSLNAHLVFEFLKRVPTPTPAAKRKVFECFSAWTSYSLLTYDRPDQYYIEDCTKDEDEISRDATENLSGGNAVPLGGGGAGNQVRTPENATTGGQHEAGLRDAVRAKQVQNRQKAEDLLFSDDSLLMSCFENLSNDELGDLSSEVLSESINLLDPEELNNSQDARMQRIVQWLIGCILALKPGFEQMLEITLSTGASPTRQTVSLEALRRHTKVFAATDPQTASLVTPFWWKLAEHAFYRAPYDSKRNPMIKPEFRTAFSTLLKTVVDSQTLPSEIRNPLEEMDEDWSSFRKDLNDVTCRTFDFILTKNEAMDIVLESFMNMENSTPDPTTLLLKQEAHMHVLAYCARNLYPPMDTDPETHPVYKICQQMIPPLLKGQTDPSGNTYWMEWTQLAALELVRDLSGWLIPSRNKLVLKETTPYMLSAMDALCQTLMTAGKSPAIYRAASDSFLQLCLQSDMMIEEATKYRCVMIPHLDTLLKVYECTLPTLPVRCHIDVTEGVSYVLARISDVQAFQNGLEKLVLPMIQAMQHENVTPQNLAEIMDRLSKMMDALKFKETHNKYRENAADPDAMQQILGQVFLQHLFPLVNNQLSRKYYSESNLIEKITKFQKHALRNMPQIFEQVLPQFIEVVNECFEKKQLSSWLYASEFTVDTYGKDHYANDPVKGQLLKNIFYSLAQTGLKTLVTQKQKPHVDAGKPTYHKMNDLLGGMSAELTEDFFGMFQRYVKIVPHTVFESDVFFPSLELVPGALLMPCKETVEAVMGYCEAILQRPGEASTYLLDKSGEQLFAASLLAYAQTPDWHIQKVYPSFFSELHYAAHQHGKMPEFHLWVTNSVMNQIPWKQIASQEEVRFWIQCLQNFNVIYPDLVQSTGYPYDISRAAENVLYEISIRYQEHLKRLRDTD